MPSTVVAPGTFSTPASNNAIAKLSKGLDLFREEWSGSKGEQNVPSVFLLDKDGVVQFKLVAQHTMDRPSAAYLERIMKALL